MALEKAEIIPVAIHIGKEGDVSVTIAEENHRQVMAMLAQMFCGAFDIAGEHDQLVCDTLAAMALTRAGWKAEKDARTWQ